MADKKLKPKAAGKKAYREDLRKLGVKKGSQGKRMREGKHLRTPGA